MNFIGGISMLTSFTASAGAFHSLSSEQSGSKISSNTMYTFCWMINYTLTKEFKSLEHGGNAISLSLSGLRMHISWTKRLFCIAIKVESVCLETHNNRVGRLSHRFWFEMVLYYHHHWCLARTWLLLYLADDVLELEDKGGRRSSIWPTHLVHPE